MRNGYPDQIVLAALNGDDGAERSDGKGDGQQSREIFNVDDNGKFFRVNAGLRDEKKIAAWRESRNVKEPFLFDLTDS